MLSTSGRSVVSGVVEPIARKLNKWGITPNSVTIAGTVIASCSAVVFIATGHLFLAAVIVGLTSATDLLDGTMARLRGGGTKFGATLDASCDRIVDGAIFGAFVWWLAFGNFADHDLGPDAAWYANTQILMALALVVLVASQVTSYVKARAEASGIKVDGGAIERPERLIISLIAIGLTGLGVPYILMFGFVVLTVGSIYTVVERLMMVERSDKAQDTIAAPTGAKEFSE